MVGGWALGEAWTNRLASARRRGMFRAGRPLRLVEFDSPPPHFVGIVEGTKIVKPTMAMTGEIRFEDGTSMLVPQPCKESWFRLDDAYVFATYPELPSHTEVLQHAHSTAKRTGDPLWARLCAGGGGVLLVVVGVLLTAIHGYRLMS